MNGAYVDRKDPAFCRERLETVRRLAPVVKPESPDDSQLVSGPKALFQTAAACFARAGDCASAWKAYRDEYPPDALASIKDARQKDQIVRAAFDSTVERCKGK